MADVVRRVVIQGRSEGLDKVTSDLRGVAAAQQQVGTASRATATVTDITTRRALSTTTAYDRLRRSIDGVHRDNMRFAQGQRVLNQALEQGRIDASQMGRQLDLLAQKYRQADAAQDRLAVGTGRLAAARQGLTGAAGAFGLGIAVGGVAGLALGIPMLARKAVEAVNSLDDLGDAAQRAAISGEKLQVLRYALEQTTGSAEAADAGMQRFARSVGELAVTGGGPAKAAFDALGISIRNTSGAVKTQEELFDEVAKTFPRISNAASASAIATRLFGREMGPAMAALLQQGVEGLDAYETKLHELGGVISNEMLASADAVQKRFNDLNIQWDSAWKRMAITFFEFEIDVGAISHRILERLSEVFGEAERLQNLGADIGTTVGDLLTNPAGRVATVPEDLTAQVELRKKLEELAELQKLLLEPKIDVNISDDDETDAVADRATKALERQRDAVADLVSDLRFEQEQMGRNSVEQRIQVALRKAGTEATVAQREAIRETITLIEAQRKAEEKQAEAQNETINRLDENREVLRGFLTGMVQDLRNGATAWEALGSTVLNVLERIADRLAQMAEDMIIDALLGKQGTTGQGLLGGLFRQGGGGGKQKIGGAAGAAALALGLSRNPYETGRASATYAAPLGAVTGRDLPPLAERAIDALERLFAAPRPGGGRSTLQYVGSAGGAQYAGSLGAPGSAFSPPDAANPYGFGSRPQPRLPRPYTPPSPAPPSMLSPGQRVYNIFDLHNRRIDENLWQQTNRKAMEFVGNYREGVDARLTDILNKAALESGQRVEAFSGFRPGDSRFHGRGMATDIRLFDPRTGQPLPNYQNAGSFRGYEQFAQQARMVQMRDYPELNNNFRWGGYFSGGRGKYGAMDQMHFDLGRGMGGGSWEGGLNTQQRGLWPGAESIGMGTEQAGQRITESLNKIGTSIAEQAQSFVPQFGGALEKLLTAFRGGGGGGQGGFGGFLNSILGGGFYSGPPLPGFGLHASGGYTGDGGKFEPAGLVHRGEFVINAGSTRAFRPLLESINARGYAAGGYVTPASGGGRSGFAEVVVNNYGKPDNVSVRETEGSRGRRLEIMVDEAVAGAVAKGPKTRQANAMAYGARPRIPGLSG